MIFGNVKIITFNSALKCSFCLNRILVNKLSVHATISNVEAIQKVLGCTENEAIEGISSSEHIQKLTGDELVQRLGILQKLGVADISNKHGIYLTKYHPSTLKNRIMFMQECGFRDDKINPNSVKKFLSLTHCTINVLKEKHFIETSTDVYKRMLSFAQLMECYTPQPDSVDIVSVKLELLRHLLKKELDISDEVLIKNKEILKRLKNKSIRIIKENIHIAKNILEISPYKICRNPSMLWVDPDNTLKVIKEIKEIAGIDIKMCMSLFPKIIGASYENTKDIIDCLKEHNFSDNAIQKGLCLFTLSSKNVRERLKDLEKEEFFNVSKQNLRALMLVYYFKKVKLRLRLLRELNIYNTTFSTVSTSDQKRFDRYYEHGSMRQPGHDIINYICSELCCEKKEFLNKVRRFPYWRYVPTIEIAKNLKLLRENGFSDDDIFNNVYILLYNKTKIMEELNALDKKEDLDCCKENGTIKKNHILALVIYFIEKSQNFSVSPFCNSEEETRTHADIDIPNNRVIVEQEK